MLPSAYSGPRRQGGSIPPRDSVIANSELPLRILKFRAPAAARYPGENALRAFVRPRCC